MDSDLLKILSEELRETRALARAAEKHADAAMLEAKAAMQEAKASEQQAVAAVKKADASWELVIITRNQVKEELAYLRLPWWKKLFGKTA
jgi:uncharacterized membrane protein YqiK